MNTKEQIMTILGESFNDSEKQFIKYMLSKRDSEKKFITFNIKDYSQYEPSKNMDELFGDVYKYMTKLKNVKIEFEDTEGCIRALNCLIFYIINPNSMNIECKFNEDLVQFLGDLVQ